MKSYITVMFALSIVFGCKDKTTDPINSSDKGNTLTAYTNKPSYAVNETLFVTLKNEVIDTVYFVHCNHRVAFYIQLKSSNEWTEAGSVAVWCNGFVPSGIYAFPRSRNYTDSIALTQAGTYRLLFPYILRDNPRTLDSLFTNEFTIQ